MSITVSAQQAFNFAQLVVTQTTSTTNPVVAYACNVSITTQAYTNAPGVSQTFAYQNPLISLPPNSNVSATILDYNGGTGNPVLSLSGQTNGVIYITITNAHPTISLNSTLSIAVLIYQAESL